MKILLDENLPIKLKDKLVGYEAYTVRYMNWYSVKNGALLKLAIENEFDIFITTDKNLQYQQKIQSIDMAIVVLNVPLLKWSYIEPLLPKLLERLPTFEKRNIYVID